jgi:transposase-like protein
METMSIKTTFSLGKVYCNIFGHRYRVTKKITSHVKEYQCMLCNCEATNDDKGKITSLTPQLKDINQTLISFHKKKNHAF